MISEYKNEGVLLNACKDICLTVNLTNTKYMELRHRRGMIANKHITICSNWYAKVKKTKWVESLLTIQNFVHEEIKFRLKKNKIILFYPNTCIFSTSLQECEN